MTWAIDRVKLVCRKNRYGKSLSLYRFFLVLKFSNLYCIHRATKVFQKKKIGAIPHEFQKKILHQKLVVNTNIFPNGTGRKISFHHIM